MATLTNADYGELREFCYRQGLGKEELKALVGGLPSESQLKAAFQYLEDQFVGLFATWKGGLETALGRSITNPLAQKMIAAYCKWKIKQILG